MMRYDDSTDGSALTRGASGVLVGNGGWCPEARSPYLAGPGGPTPISYGMEL